MACFVHQRIYSFMLIESSCLCQHLVLGLALPFPVRALGFHVLNFEIVQRIEKLIVRNIERLKILKSRQVGEINNWKAQFGSVIIQAVLHVLVGQQHRKEMVKTVWTSIAFLNGAQCLNDVAHGLFPCSWPFVGCRSLSNCFNLSFPTSPKLRAVLSARSHRLNIFIPWFIRKGFRLGHRSIRKI